MGRLIFILFSVFIALLIAYIVLRILDVIKGMFNKGDRKSFEEDIDKLANKIKNK